MESNNEIKEMEENPSNEIATTSSDDIAIEIKNLTMEFKVSKDKIDTLKEYAIRTLKRNKEETKKIRVLEDISFTVRKGDRLGILGYNGAGKSTLLKIVSGIYEPTSGEVKINGKIAPLLELGAGFDENYSGRNNIFLNAAFLSMDEEFIEKKYDEIVEFSELGDFINFPVKNYSSGMRAKLGFSIATMINPDILIIDEILSVGDIKFKKKSSQKIKSLMSEGVTVLLVSHGINQIRDICNRCIWIENGHLIMDGEAEAVCDAYEESVNRDDSKIDPWIGLPDKDSYRMGEYIIVTLKESEDGKPLANEKLIISINEDKYSRVTNSQGQIGLQGTEIGNQYFKVSFKGNSKVNPKTVTFNKEITASKHDIELPELVMDENKINSKLIVSDEETLSKGDYLIIQLVEDIENGKPLKGEELDVTFDSIEMKRITNNKGKIGLATHRLGTHQYIIEYQGNDKINPQRIEFEKDVVDEDDIYAYDDSDMDKNKINPIIRSDCDKTLHKGDAISFSFRGEDGTKISKEKITVYINGEKYTRTTNEHGHVAFTTTETGPHNIKVNYPGNDKINPKTVLFSKIVTE